MSYQAQQLTQAWPNALGREYEIQRARRQLAAAIATLPATQREAVLVFAEGGSEVAAAERLGVTRQAMWDARQRAFEKLRRALRAKGIQSTADLIASEAPFEAAL